MFQSIIFKEWLKIRVPVLISVLTGLIFSLDLYYGLYRGVELSTTKDFWYTILFNRISWYSHLKVIPVLIALLISIAQFYPEIFDKRLKLTLHLPVRENKILLQMIGFGSAAMLLIFTMMFALFLFISRHFLPSNLVYPGAVTIVPWFLAGITVYFLVAFIVLEPVWKFRIAYAIVGIHIVAIYLLDAGMGAYQPAIHTLVLITGLSSLSVFYSAYRLRKGKR